MMTLSATALMIAIESGIIVYAAAAAGPHRLIGTCCCFHMLMIALFAPVLIEFDGAVSNITNIAYATLVCGQVLVLERSGPSDAKRAIGIVNGLLTALFVFGFGFQMFPAVPGNEIEHEAARLIVSRNPELIIASYVAFFTSQMVLVLVWQRVRPYLGPVSAMVVAAWACQAVDTPAFFYIAFVRMLDTADLVNAMATGFVFKCAVGVALIPAFVVGMQWHDISAGFRGGLVDASATWRRRRSAGQSE